MNASLSPPDLKHSSNQKSLPMQNPRSVVTALERLFDEARTGERTLQIAAYAAMTIMVNELDRYATEENMSPGSAYVGEKLVSFQYYMQAALGMDDAQGQSHERMFEIAWDKLQTVRELFESA
ncbi:MAG: hypothetical protein IPK22_05270 [Verrucomicrobiaceae bacterium]|nr:hypothetical protein [Verrucomicrobiaceae bacterium]